MTVLPVYDRADWSSAFRNVGVELDGVAVTAARGTIPPELQGTLYRNGPGRMERGGQWVHHPFDGDGMITALRFGPEGVKLSNRFVRTEAWLAEEQAGKFLYRGVFGTQKPGGVLANAFKGSPTRFCLFSFTSDWLFPTRESRMVVHALNAAAANVSFVEIESDKGHDAFLLDVPEMFQTLHGFIDSVSVARGLSPSTQAAQ